MKLIALGVSDAMFDRVLRALKREGLALADYDVTRSPFFGAHVDEWRDVISVRTSGRPTSRSAR